MVQIDPDIPVPGQPDWAGPLNAVLEALVAQGNASDAEINGRLSGANIATDITNAIIAQVRIPFVFSKTGTIAISTGTHRQYNDSGRTLTLLAARAALGTAPTGSAATFDVKKNGVTVLTSPLSVAAAGNASSAVVPNVTTLADGDYLTVDVVSIGSTTAGSDLTVTIWAR